jgi:hypothetical protein
MKSKTSSSEKHTSKLAALFAAAVYASESNDPSRAKLNAGIERQLPELLAAGADPDGTANLERIGIKQAGFLLCACMIGSQVCAQALLDSGADPNAVSPDDNANPATPLWALCRDRLSSDDFLNALLGSGADPFSPCSQTTSPQFDPSFKSTPGPAILWLFFLGRAVAIKACLDIAAESQAMDLLRHLRDSQSWSAQARHAWTTHPILKSPSVIAEIVRLQSGQDASEYSALLAGVERDKLCEATDASLDNGPARAPKRI